jgi:hypothetical protein
MAPSDVQYFLVHSNEANIFRVIQLIFGCYYGTPV